MSAQQSLLPEGLDDRLPDEAEAAARCMRAMVDAAAAHGYRRVQPPLAEYEDTLSARLKRAGRRDLARFVDPVSQRTLALRPDITAQVGRIAATRLAAAPRPLRLAYAGPVMKLRATGVHRAREVTQVGAELIGSDGVAAATEAAGVALDALDAAGVRGAILDFTLPDLVDALAAPGGPLPLPEQSVEPVRAALDAKDAGALADLGAHAYLPLLEAAGPFDAALAALRRIDAGGALRDRLDALAAVAAALGGHARLGLDPTERHGFEYQSWFGFSLFVPGLGVEIGRGGSYAILHPDGREEPAVGFSLFPDLLIDRAAERPRPSVFVPLGLPAAAGARLRGEGWATVAALSSADDPAALGCTHILDRPAGEPRPL